MSLLLKTPSLLVALPRLMDPHFHKAVVLLVKQDKEGAYGYVINKPMPLSLRDATFQKRYQIPNHVPVWMGGPVGANEGVVVHNQGSDAAAIFSEGDLRVSSSEEAIEGFIQHVESEEPSMRKRGSIFHPYRFVIGFSTWGPKQLENELKAGLWIQLPLDTKLIFTTPWQEMWMSAVDDLGVDLLTIAPGVQNYLS